MSVKWSATNI